MKPTMSERESTDGASRRADNIENRKWHVGARVERDLDGIWFTATIVARGDDGAFEIEYDEDQNRESGITEDELRPLDEKRQLDRPQTSAGRPQTALSPQQQVELMRDSLLLQANDYDPNKAPTVVLHRRGETHAGATLDRRRFSLAASSC